MQEIENGRGRDCLFKAPNGGVQTFHSTGEEQRFLSKGITPGRGRIEGLRQGCVTTQYLHTVADQRLDDRSDLMEEKWVKRGQRLLEK